ncbi:RHS repeat-associated core domain-containing protein [Methylobacterium indicum]|uniref:RHS repeat-associated core domain-containing protein n=1 Tax=Methylobacterium indicum TaxID=1775910 RepID=UPI000A4B6F49
MCPIRFQGQWQDAETGLVYNRFRYYDALTGQYVSSDPIGLAGGFRGQGYVRQPASWIDPQVLACCTPRYDEVAKKYGGTRVEGGYKFSTQRQAMQAASEMTGDLGSNPVTTRRQDFRGGPWSWQDNPGVIGRQSQDNLVGWRNDSLGHPNLGMGPHVNVWTRDGGNAHLFY